jgi:hypothetical protein
MDVVCGFHAILADHRVPAVVELAIRDLEPGGVAQLPSGDLHRQPRLARFGRVRSPPRRRAPVATSDRWLQASTETLPQSLY